MKKQKEDLLAASSSEAIRLGMSYGQFSAMCQDKYPYYRTPIARYFADKDLAQGGAGGEENGKG